MNFDQFFRQATGHGPYPYQTRLAEAKATEFPQLLDIGTDCIRSKPADCGEHDAGVPRSDLLRGSRVQL